MSNGSSFYVSPRVMRKQPGFKFETVIDSIYNDPDSELWKRSQSFISQVNLVATKWSWTTLTKEIIEMVPYYGEFEVFLKPQTVDFKNFLYFNIEDPKEAMLVRLSVPGLERVDYVGDRGLSPST